MLESDNNETLELEIDNDTREAFWSLVEALIKIEENNQVRVEWILNSN